MLALACIAIVSLRRADVSRRPQRAVALRQSPCYETPATGGTQQDKGGFIMELLSKI